MSDAALYHVIRWSVTAMSAGERANMSATTLHHWLFPETSRTKIARPWGHA